MKDDFIQTVLPYTMVGPVRLFSLCELSQRIEYDQVPGDVIECGVCNGGSAAILAHYATKSSLDRKVWLLDSFQGLPNTTVEVDGKDAPLHQGSYVGQIEVVREVLQLVEATMDKVYILEGWFKDTLPLVSAQQIALLNLDCDWYESVKQCLETLYDRVVPGGFISFDDYNFWPGCKRAVDEFFKSRNLTYVLNQVECACWFRKN